ncbi:Kelch-like ECH-associated protein 1 [Papilio machaon]|uniref:Kelch-like protein diablo n=1 Tax=Papilio machaon TaxID=76193 RepID=A0A194R1X7_PAPMA|nr:Kelch-like ECH-associated protein 1 [Papilio machaon]
MKLDKSIHQSTYVSDDDANDMDTDEEVGRGNLLDGMPPINCDTTIDDAATTGNNDIGDMTFCLSNYVPDFMKMLFTMRSHHMLTDVVLEVGNELFHVHKVVLAAGSPYFKAMFTSGLKESEMSRVRLQGVCPSAMAWLVYFMYTGKVRITEVTVCQLLPAATMFQISNVMEACCAFLERQLDPSNAIGIANFSEQHGCVKLKQKANQFIERHFTEVCREEEFLQLTAPELISLIRKDELNVREEREVYNAVLSWVKYDEDRRYPRMEHILQAVRCQYLTPSFLKEQMNTCTVLKKVPACREYLAKIFKDLTLHKKPVVKERRPNTPRIIYVAGGYFRHSIDVFEAFNLDDNCWSTLPRLTVPRSGLGAAFLKGLFYAVGGRNTSPGSSYDSDWEYVLVMLFCSYDPESDTWTHVAAMGSARLGVGVAVVNRLLYAVGGFDGTRRVRSVECYHPENNRWSDVAPMQVARSGAGVAALNQYIYVVGGYDGAQQLASVERYDTERDVWECVAPVNVARSALSLTVLDNKLYAMGGYDGTSFLDIVEVYDPETNTWKLGTPLTSVRSGHASAVCYQHVAPPPEPPEPEPAVIRKLGKRPAPKPGTSTSSSATSIGDDVPMANNIIGTLSNDRYDL